MASPEKFKPSQIILRTEGHRSRVQKEIISLVFPTTNNAVSFQHIECEGHGSCYITVILFAEARESLGTC